jgi:hypothetical protein
MKDIFLCDFKCGEDIITKSQYALATISILQTNFFLLFRWKKGKIEQLRFILILSITKAGLFRIKTTRNKNKQKQQNQKTNRKE